MTTTTLRQAFSKVVQGHVDDLVTLCFEVLLHKERVPSRRRGEFNYNLGSLTLRGHLKTHLCNLVCLLQDVPGVKGLFTRLARECRPVERPNLFVFCVLERMIMVDHLPCTDVQEDLDHAIEHLKGMVEPTRLLFPAELKSLRARRRRTLVRGDGKRRRRMFPFRPNVRASGLPDDPISSSDDDDQEAEWHG